MTPIPPPLLSESDLRAKLKALIADVKIEETAALIGCTQNYIYNMTSNRPTHRPLAEMVARFFRYDKIVYKKGILYLRDDIDLEQVLRGLK